MQTTLDVVMASPIKDRVAVVCHVSSGELELGMILHARNKQGAWKVTSLGWPTLAQMRGAASNRGIVLLPLDQAISLQDGDILASDTLH